MSISLFLAANIVSIILALAAAFLCWKSREGWGWFLFGALMTFGSVATITALPTG